MPPVWLSTAVASKWFKIGVGVVALLALVWGVRGVIQSLNVHDEAIRTAAYNSGFNTSEARWQKASAAGALAQRDQIVKDVANSNNAVSSYLADIANRAPLLVPVKERTVVYEKSAAGSTVCLDPDGVRLWQDFRTASGLSGAPATPNASPAPVR